MKLMCNVSPQIIKWTCCSLTTNEEKPAQDPKVVIQQHMSSVKAIIHQRGLQYQMWETERLTYRECLYAQVIRQEKVWSWTPRSNVSTNADGDSPGTSDVLAAAAAAWYEWIHFIRSINTGCKQRD